MPFQVTCDKCGRQLLASTSGSVPCPECGHVQTVSDLDDNPTGDLGGILGIFLAAGDSAQQDSASLLFRSSRWAWMFGGRVNDLLHPPTFVVRDDCIEIWRVRSVLQHATRVEKVPLSKVVSYQHRNGLIWDSVTVEIAGEANNLCMHGISKLDAARFAAVLDESIAHVRNTQLKR